MKKFAILALCLVLIMRCASVLGESAAQKEFQLGESHYFITIDESFVEGERTSEEIADDMVAYMHSPNTLLDFDVYAFSKEGYPETLADFATQEAADYNATEMATDVSINGIATAWYRCTEAYDGTEYTTLNYIFDDGSQYVEITFWLDGETAEQEANVIISTLRRAE